MKKMGFAMLSAMGFMMLFGMTIVHGQTPADQENFFQTGEQTKVVTQAIEGDTVNDLNLIGVRFCNDGLDKNKLNNHLEMQIQPGQKKDICILFFNTSSEKSIDIKFGFSSTNVNNDGGISCDDDMTTKNNFSKMIDQSNVTGFTIAPMDEVVKKVKMYVPSAYTGKTIYGCLSYKINKEEKMDPGQVFLLVFRKTAPIQVKVMGGIYKFGRRDDVKDVYITNKQTILKIVIGILGIWLLFSIIKTKKSKKKHTKK